MAKKKPTKKIAKHGRSKTKTIYKKTKKGTRKREKGINNKNTKSSSKNRSTNKRSKKRTSEKILLKVRKVSTKGTKTGAGKSKGTKTVLYFENDKGKQVRRSEVKKKYGLINEDFKFLQGQANKGAKEKEFKSLFSELKKHRNYDVLIDYDHINKSFPNKYFYYNDEPLSRKEVQNKILEYAKEINNLLPFYSFKINCEIIGKQVTINLSGQIFEFALEQSELEGTEKQDFSMLDDDGNFILFNS